MLPKSLEKIAITFLFLSLLIGNNGCGAAITENMQSWMGKHQNELIAAWGAPQQVMEDGQGGKILIFSAQRTFTSPGYATGYATSSGSLVGSSYYGSTTGSATYFPARTTSYTASRMFWVDQNGYIYKWSWKGL